MKKCEIWTDEQFDLRCMLWCYIVSNEYQANISIVTRLVIKVLTSVSNHPDRTDNIKGDMTQKCFVFMQFPYHSYVQFSH